MRRSLLATLALTLAFALLAGCAAPAQTDPSPAQDPEEYETGQVTDNTDPNAPKTVSSTEITQFYCYFSTTTMAEPGTLGNSRFTMSAKKDGDTVTGSLQIDGMREFSREFAADASFMEELQSVGYEMFEMAQYNGISHHVAGLPEDFGATLDVQYASGESIYAADNQDNFLSFGLMSALVDLFTQACAVEPTLLAVQTESKFDDTEKGYVSYPALTVAETGRDALADALTEISAAEAEQGHACAQRFGDAPEQGALRYEANATVTRSDSEYVSLYTRTERYEDASWDEPMVEYRGYTIETATGRQLGFRDILHDMQLMPIAIEQEIAATYPEAELYEDASEFLRQSVEQDDGNVTFALSYGGIHIFVNEYVVSDEPGGLHVVLDYASYPHLLNAVFTTAPEAYMLPLDYGPVYRLADGTSLQLGCDETEESDVRWSLFVNGMPLEREYYGYAPECRLIYEQGRYLVYVRVPSGDVSMLTDVFAVTPEGAEALGSVPLASDDPAGMDPAMMKMALDNIAYSAATTLIPSGWYRVGDDGMPEPVGNLFTLAGMPVALKERGRYNPADRADAAASGGMWNMIEGEVLTPLQTDLSTFIDFITDDGRVVRFEIDGFGSEMQLDNFGTLDDVFDPTYG